MQQSLNQADPITLGITEMLAEFKDSPSQFAKDFGLTAWYAVQAWFIIAIPLTVGLYLLLKNALRKYAARFFNPQVLAS